MSSMVSKQVSRLKRKKRIRKKILGTDSKPRLSVFRSSKHIYAQIIDDRQGHTLAAASSLEKDFQNNPGLEEILQKDDKGKSIGSKQAEAILVGKLIAERAIEKGIKKVIFDRNGYLYHGRVKAVSDGARGAGLEF